jgi:hypothetical protein
MLLWVWRESLGWEWKIGAVEGGLAVWEREKGGWNWWCAVEVGRLELVVLILGMGERKRERGFEEEEFERERELKKMKRERENFFF